MITQRDTFYIHNIGADALKEAKDKIRQRFKVIEHSGPVELVVIECSCLYNKWSNTNRLKVELRKLIGRPVTHISTEHKSHIS